MPFQPEQRISSIATALLGSVMLGLASIACAEERALVSEDQYMAMPPVAADQRIHYGADPMQFGDLYLPKGGTRAPVVVLVHGGCWMARYGLEPLGKLASTLRSQGLAVWSLEYRRVGNGGGWPTTYEDVAAGTDFVRELAKRHPVDPARVVIVGHSAGGHLSAWLASRHKIPAGLPFHSRNPLKPIGSVTLAGVLDMRDAIEGDLRKGMDECSKATFAMIGATSKEQPRRYRAASPIELLPTGVPHWILVGEHDNPSRIEQLKRYGELARSKGDDARFQVLQGAGHFELVDVDGPFWNSTLSAIKSAAGGGELADVVYRNGRIYTVDDRGSWAQAVAIANGKFVYVGDDAGVAKYIGQGTRTVDLKGRMVMPGLHDAHQHLLKAQLRNINCNVPSDSRVEQIVAALRKCEQGKGPKDWILADAYRGDLFPEGKAHRKYLDEAFPERPIFIREWSYHHGLANTAALRLAGVDRNTADPPSGRVLRDENGEPTGELLSKATWLVTRVMPPLPDATVREALLASARACNRYGITSVQEATANRQVLDQLKALDEAGKWPLRTAAHIVWGNPASSLDAEQTMEASIADRAKYRTKHISADFIKVYVDGSPLQPHATDVQLDEHGQVPVGRLYETPDVLNAALTRFDKLGMKVKMHAVGDGATRVALDAVEAARRANGKSGIYHDIAHSLRYSRQDIERLAKLDVVGEMSPAIWQIKGDLTANLAGAWPFRSLQDQGTLLTLGSDWVILPAPNLFPALAGVLDHGNESLRLDEAIRAVTINGARSVGWQQSSGSIEVGKHADMIVLDRNLFEIEPADIAETRVLRTVLGGEEVYSRARASGSL